MKGALIVFEGPDGSGTTLHSKLFAEHLESMGNDVFLTAEPTKEGPIGVFIRNSLHGPKRLSPAALQSLFTADRAWHIEQEMKPALAAGKTVVCDRYIPSTIVYGKSLGLPLQWLKNMNNNFIQEDRLILALPPYAVCRERIARRQRHDPLEEDSLQRKVYDEYKAYAKEHPHVIAIDTSGDKEEVAESIRAALKA